VGARFQQGDDSIVVLGKLRNIVETAKEGVSNAAAEPEQQFVAASVGKEDDGLRKVVVDVASAKPAAAAPRRRQVRLNPGAIQNEPPSQGTVEGKP
jgi:hypothetical protein